MTVPTIRSKRLFSVAAGSAEPVDIGGEPPDDGGMDERIKKLETLAEKTTERLIVIERDVAVIKSSMASKADVAEAKSGIIISVVIAIFLAQLLPLIKSLIVP